MNNVLCLLRTSMYCSIIYASEYRSVKEKRRLLIQRKRTDYEQVYNNYSHIVITQDSLLTYKDGTNKDRVILCLHDGEHNIDFSVLKKELGIPKKKDLRFYKGDISALIGSESGAVSPFAAKTAAIDGMYFDERMMEAAYGTKNVVYDMAITTRSSLFANVADV